MWQSCCYCTPTMCWPCAGLHAAGQRHPGVSPAVPTCRQQLARGCLGASSLAQQVCVLIDAGRVVSRKGRHQARACRPNHGPASTLQSLVWATHEQALPAGPAQPLATAHHGRPWLAAGFQQSLQALPAVQGSLDCRALGVGCTGLQGSLAGQRSTSAAKAPLQALCKASRKLAKGAGKLLTCSCRPCSLRWWGCCGC